LAQAWEYSAVKGAFLIFKLAVVLTLSACLNKAWADSSDSLVGKYAARNLAQIHLFADGTFCDVSFDRGPDVFVSGNWREATTTGGVSEVQLQAIDRAEQERISVYESTVDWMKANYGDSYVIYISISLKQMLSGDVILGIHPDQMKLLAIPHPAFSNEKPKGNDPIVLSPEVRNLYIGFRVKESLNYEIEKYELLVGKNGVNIMIAPTSAPKQTLVVVEGQVLRKGDQVFRRMNENEDQAAKLKRSCSESPKDVAVADPSFVQPLERSIRRIQVDPSESWMRYQ
jgi:hypothetical protein